MAGGEGIKAGLEYLEYSNATRWIILIAVMLGQLMVVVDSSIVNVAMPTMMGNLGVTLTEISWVSTGYIIANVIMLPLTGWFSIRFGRRKYLATSMVIFTVASFCCGTARSLEMLVIFRVMQGVGGAAMVATAQATIMEIFPPYQLGMVQAIFGIGIMVGPSIGPTLGGWITDTYSWPWIFFINLPLGILATILTLLFMHDSKIDHGPHKDGVDFVGIGLLAIGLGCMQTMLEEGNTDNWFDSHFICWMAALAVAGIVSFIIWELHTENPAVNLRVLRHKEFAAGTLFVTVVGVGLFGGLFILPMFLQNLRGLTAQQCGIAMLPGAIATAIMMPIVGKLTSYIAPRTLVFIGSLGVLLSNVLLYHLSMDTGAAQIFWPLVLRGVSMGCLFIPLMLATLMKLRGKEIGQGTGLFSLSQQLGGSVGIALLSTFVTRQALAHRAALVAHVTVFNPLAQYRLLEMQAFFMQKGSSAPVAYLRGLHLLDLTINGQAAVLSFGDAFMLIALLFLAALPVLFLFKGGKMSTRGKPSTVHMD